VDPLRPALATHTLPRAALMDRATTAEPFLALLSGVVLAFALLLALGRMGHPLPLAAAEGEHVVAVARLAQGGALYVEPSLAFIDPTPAPLFHGAAAALTRALGPGFTAPRLVALAFAAGALGLAFALVRRATGRALGGWIACALFVLLEPGLDLARPESLLVALLLAAMALLLAARRAAQGMLAALVAALAWLAHPPEAPVVAAALAAGTLCVRPRHGLVFVGTLAALLASGALLLAAVAEPYGYAYHAFELPRRLALDARSWCGPAVARAIPALCVAWLAWAWMAAAARAHRRRVDAYRDTCRFVAAAVPALLAADFLLRPPGGASPTCLHALLALATGLAADVVLARASAPGKRLVAAAVVLQLLLVCPDPRLLLPDREKARSAAALVARAAALEGELQAPFAPWLLVRLGRPPHASYPALLELRRADSELAGVLLQGLRAEIVAKRYAAILWTEGEPPGYLRAHYAPAGPGATAWSVLTPR
jgi:hypothetical protein